MKPSSSRRRIAPGDPAAPANHIAIGGAACVFSAGSALFRDCWPAGGVMRALGRIRRNVVHRPSPYLATARASEAAAAVGALALSARDHAAQSGRVRRADRQSVLHADHAASNTIFDRHPRVRYGAGGLCALQRPKTRRGPRQGPYGANQLRQNAVAAPLPPLGSAKTTALGRGRDRAGLSCVASRPGVSALVRRSAFAASSRETGLRPTAGLSGTEVKTHAALETADTAA